MSFPFENMQEVANDDEWHALRRSRGGSSDAAALFGYGYADRPSAWSVYATLAGLVPYEVSDDDQDDRMWMGKELEPIIARFVTRRKGWDLLPGARWYCKHPTIPIMGCTVDNFVLNPEDRDGIGIVETKARDWLEFKDSYFDPITGEEALAMRDKIQIAHQLACLPEVKWACGAVLVNGNDLKDFVIPRADFADMIEDIESAWQEMSRRLAERDEPDIVAKEIPKWLQAHFEAFGKMEPKIIEDLSMDEAMQDYLDKDAEAKAAAKVASNAKARILQTAGENAVLLSNRYRAKISRSEVPGGISERKPYTRVTVKVEPFERASGDPEAMAAAMAAQAPIDTGN